MALTPLAVAALGLLIERPMHPYEMFQTLVARQEDQVVKVRPGSLYHAVDRMAAEGLVEVVGTDREGRRPERTTYRATTAGEHAVQGWIRAVLREPVNEYPGFRLALGEAHNLPRDEVLALLTERLSLLRADEAALHEAGGMLDGKRLEERFWLDVPYQLAVLTAEIHFLTTLVDRIAAGGIAWPPPGEHHSPYRA